MKSFDLDWGRLAYSDSGGAGPCALFLHGTGCDATHWAQTLAELGGALRAVCADFRSHGESDSPAGPFTLEALAQDVIALMDRLDLPRATLVGHSLGGMVAMEAARRDRRVSALVLVEGWTSLRAADAFVRNRHYGTLPPEKAAWIKERWNSMRRRFTEKNWNCFADSLAAFDACAFLETARIPIYEVYGAQGRAPGIERRLLVPENPNIRWRWIPNGGHYLPLEFPRALAEICLEAVREEPGSPKQPPPARP